MPPARTILSRLLRGLAAVAGACLALPAAAATISNTATISWTVDGVTLSRPSNRVDLTLQGATAALAAQALNESAEAADSAVLGSVCRGSSGDIPFALEGAFARPRAQRPASVATVAGGVRAGEPIVLVLTSPDDNRSATIAEQLTVSVSTPAGDRETLVLTESGPDTGRFVGALRTAAIPPVPTPADCALSLNPGDTIVLTADRSGGETIASVTLDILIDPYGLVFDSADGSPVDGVRVTLIDDVTGQPATVFGDDAVSRFPHTVTTGGTVTDAAGFAYRFPPGEYRFPFAPPGRYRLRLEPPTPYTAPSKVEPPDLAALRRPDGLPLALAAASYGGTVVLADPAPVRIDVPLDRPGAAVSLTKVAGLAVASVGDTVPYTITITNADTERATTRLTVTDQMPDGLRLQAGSVRLNNLAVDYELAGNTLSIAVPPLAAASSAKLTYLLTVRPDARAGTALNRAFATDAAGVSTAPADAIVRITNEVLAERMTLIGRVVRGACGVAGRATAGVANIRLLLEDGSYAVTDGDGRYHFDGLLPGRHVVAVDEGALAPGQRVAPCDAGTTTADSAASRIVSGTGGALLRADFRIVGEAAAPVLTPRPAVLTDAAAAGAERDWLAGQAPGIAWLFPEPEHNPRNPVVRVAIKHGPTHAVTLFVDGKKASPLTLDGTTRSADGQTVVSLWRAITLSGRRTELSAEVRLADGTLVTTLRRTVIFATNPMNAQFLPAQSRLVADGLTRPVIALRLTDRDGRPVHHGVTGDFTLPAPYLPAQLADAQGDRKLAGLERARPVWRVEGDDGIARVELEPTTASGALQLALPLRDGEVTRIRTVDLWLSPGDRPWTLVGLAEGTIGYATVRRRLERSDDPSKVQREGRIALYAKGRIKGKWLLTLAYDSARSERDARFQGTIDPRAYYTVYADRSERRYDAASVRKLYLRLERPQFLALFGDFETGFNETQLARYNRALNGVKAQFGTRRVSATAFAADGVTRHRRVERQGNGLSGPYGLGVRDILPNSERIVIEVRDRLRSNLIVETRPLVRYVDYELDYAAGLLRFKEPVLSRTSALDPQFIVADFEVDGIGGRQLSAGARATWTNTDGRLRAGVTALHDDANLLAADVRFALDPATELRAEAGLAHGDRATTTAWLVEAEHHGPRYDLLAYARKQAEGYGLGQLNGSELGTRKLGFDGRVRLTPALSLAATAWNERFATTGAERSAAAFRLQHQTTAGEIRLGLLYAHDALTDGRQASSLLAQLGATRRLFNNRLELDATSEVALADRDDSIDFPSRHKFGARFAVTSDVALVGSYEVAKGDAIDARTARLGFDLRPWAGARFVASANRQDIAEYGPRSFAAFGLAQSLPLGQRWTVDATLDGNRTFSGIDRTRAVNPRFPVASGGFLAPDGTLTEDFLAVTAGATYRGDRWSATGRVERRDGDLGDRFGVTGAILRQLGEGRAIGLLASYGTTTTEAGAATRTAQLSLSWANRPEHAAFTWLNKLDLRSDKVTGATLGGRDALGGRFFVDGNVRSRRVVNSLSVNWTPGGDGHQGTELALFWGTRWASERFGGADVSGWSNVVGVDGRTKIAKSLDFGVSGTIRQVATGAATSYAYGPAVSVSPAKNTVIGVGYNLRGFRDRDYEDQRYTRAGPFVTLRMKLDGSTLEQLGLRARR